MASLIVTRGGDLGVRYPLDRAVSTIGRGSGCDILVLDERASRMHARIRLDGGRYILDDLQGNNERGGGTYVNDRPIVWHVLELDDVIRIAGASFRFEVDVELTEPTLLAASPVETRRSGAELPIREQIDGTDIGASIIGPSSAFTKPALAPAHERLLTIYEIANAISTYVDEAQLVDEILDALLRVYRNAARAAMLWFDKSTGSLIGRAEKTREGGAPVPRFPISKRALDEVIEQKQAIIFGGIDAAPGSIMGMLSNSMLCAPLVVRGEVLGAIHITSTDLLTPFVRADLDLLVGISSQAAIALKNADLHAQSLARERMRCDLEVAQEIQRRFLPLKLPRVDDWQFAAEYQPALAIGGDFYDFIHLGEDRLGVLIGDVSGKGISGALLMARVTSEFRMLAIGGGEPTEVMESVNASLIAAAHDGLFVTATYAVVDLRAATMTFCNAGHVPPFVRRAGSRTAERFETASVPLGMFEDTVFSQETFSLGFGDIVILMSDGVVESTDAERQQLGFEPVEAVIRDGGGDAETMIEEVMSLVRGFVKHADQFDDLTIVCFGRVVPSIRELSEELEPPSSLEDGRTIAVRGR